MRSIIVSTFIFLCIRTVSLSTHMSQSYTLCLQPFLQYSTLIDLWKNIKFMQISITSMTLMFIFSWGEPKTFEWFPLHLHEFKLLFLYRVNSPSLPWRELIQLHREGYLDSLHGFQMRLSHHPNHHSHYNKPMLITKTLYFDIATLLRYYPHS